MPAASAFQSQQALGHSKEREDVFKHSLIVNFSFSFRKALY